MAILPRFQVGAAVLGALALALAASVLPPAALAQQSFGEGAKGWCTGVWGGLPPECGYNSADAACRRKMESSGRTSNAVYRPANVKFPYADCKWGCPGEIGCFGAPAGAVNFACENGYSPKADGVCRLDEDPAEERPACVSLGGQSSPATDHPISLLTGAKIYSTTDFTTSDSKLAIVRQYRSFAKIGDINYGTPDNFGINWRFSFGLELHIDQYFTDTDGAEVHLPDGSSTYFKRKEDGALEANYASNYSAAKSPYRLSFVGPWPEDIRTTSTQWDLVDQDDTVWRLQTSPNQRLVARVVKITDRSGHVIDLAYGALDQIASAVDSYGRKFTFSWNTADRGGVARALSISSITLPDGSRLQYTYDGGPAGIADGGPTRLIQAQRISASGAQLDSTRYAYADARFPYHITAVRNADNVMTHAVTYDGRGRAVTSALAGDAERSTVSYGEAAAVTTRTVANALGKTAVYKFSRSSRAFRFIGVEGQASTNCAASASAVTYDASGFVLSETDEEGRVTSYTRDAVGHPLTMTRGAGTPQASTTSYIWHPSLNLPTRIVEPGLTSNFSWTSTGRLNVMTQTDTTSHTVPYATAGQLRRWTFGYAGSLLASVDGPLEGTADTTTYAYRADGSLNTVTNPLGHITTVTAVNGRGQPTSITDPNGVVTAIAYDGLGRTTSIAVDQGGAPATTSFAYDADGDVVSLTRPGGTVLTFAYDAANRLTGVSNAAGESIAYTRNALGGVTRIEVKRGSTITASRTQAFDELGRLIRTIGAEGAQTWTFGYDKTDNPTRVTDPRAKAWASGFDALNRLVSETDPDLATINLTRNGADDVAAYQDPRGLVTTYVRNGFGDVIRESNPDSGVTDYVLDLRGLVTQATDARAIVTAYAYDAAGRLTAKNFPALPVENVAYTWDGTANGNKGRGRITRIVDQAGASDFRYDARGNVLSETRVISGATYATAYGYDLADRLTSITYPSGRSVAYARDAMGRVTGVTTKATATAAAVTLASGVTWRPMAGSAAAGAPLGLPDLAQGLAARNAVPVTDGSGMNAGTAAQMAALPGTDVLTADIIQSLTYGNGFGLFKNFSADNQMYQTLVEAGATSVMNRGLASADGVNVTQAWDALDSAETQTFGYTASGRLASASGAYGTRAWTYDKVGNRVGETINGVSTVWAYPATSNRLATVKQGAATVRAFAYAANGAVTQDVRGGSTYGYGQRYAGTLSAVSLNGASQAVYVSDAFRRLRVRTLNVGATPGTTHVVWDIFGHVIAEHVVGTGLAREYVWLGDMPLAVVDATAAPAKVYFVHVDHLDRPALMTNSARQTVWKASYEPFGAVRSIIGSAALDLRFPGQWFQLESGLAYNWNRHYDPTLGRYVQPDPLGFVDGPSLYGYARQSPGMDVDPTGEFVPQLIGFGIGAGLEYLTNPCANAADILLAGGLGAVGGGLSKAALLRLGPRSLTRETGLEWSHSIPRRTVDRYASGGLNRALNQRGGLNGSWRTPASHGRHDGNRRVRGVRPMNPALSALDRIPDWLKGTGLGGGVGAAISGGGCACRL